MGVGVEGSGDPGVDVGSGSGVPYVGAGRMVPAGVSAAQSDVSSQPRRPSPHAPAASAHTATAATIIHLFISSG